MKEIIIPIEFANAVDFYGVNDANLRVLRNKFPGAKIVSRGNELKILGSDKQVKILGEKTEKMIEHFQKIGRLTESDVEQIVNGSGTAHINETNGTDNVILYGQQGIVVRARTKKQRDMVEGVENSDIVFAIGPAGTGKTYTAVALAVRALKNREIRRIILTRPAVEAGENLGFLPGDLKEKIDPYLKPLYDALHDMIPADKLNVYVERGVIEVAPLGFMRGRTLDNAFVILDEAQNATESQLKMFLTRMGPSAKFIVTGDTTQIDLPKHQPSGLIQAARIFKNVKGITFVHLDAKDVIRHKLVRDIINAYDSERKKQEKDSDKGKSN